MATSWALKKRILEVSWPARLRRRSKPAARLGSKNTTASAARAPSLVSAEREHVDAGPPGRLGRRAAEVGDGVGDARAVHVQAQAVRAGNVRQGRDLGRPIDGAAFGRLGDADRGRLGMVHAAGRGFGQRCRQHLGRELAARTRQPDQLGAAGVELRARRIRRAGCAPSRGSRSRHRAASASPAPANWRPYRWSPGRSRGRSRTARRPPRSAARSARRHRRRGPRRDSPGPIASMTSAATGATLSLPKLRFNACPQSVLKPACSP